jgi:hypothetical protein
VFLLAISFYGPSEHEHTATRSTGQAMMEIIGKFDIERKWMRKIGGFGGTGCRGVRLTKLEMHQKSWDAKFRNLTSPHAANHIYNHAFPLHA